MRRCCPSVDKVTTLMCGVPCPRCSGVFKSFHGARALRAQNDCLPTGFGRYWAQSVDFIHLNYPQRGPPWWFDRIVLCSCTCRCPSETSKILSSHKLPDAAVTRKGISRTGYVSTLLWSRKGELRQEVRQTFVKMVDEGGHSEDGWTSGHFILPDTPASESGLDHWFTSSQRGDWYQAYPIVQGECSRRRLGRATLRERFGGGARLAPNDRLQETSGLGLFKYSTAI